LKVSTPKGVGECVLLFFGFFEVILVVSVVVYYGRACFLTELFSPKFDRQEKDFLFLSFHNSNFLEKV